MGIIFTISFTYLDHGNILAAIGQAQLFRRKRFNQFKELIELHKVCCL